MTSIAQQKRNRGGWLKSHLAHWTEGNIAYISVVFSWDLGPAHSLAMYYREKGYQVHAGGPAVKIKPAALADVAQIGGDIPALPHHNPNATFTSRGCIRHCPFCIVPDIEGDLLELEDWIPKPIVCDNNLLACSRAHFERVINRLKPLHDVDFNSGLDARLLRKHHAERISELDMYRVRMSWDDVNLERQVRRAWRRLRQAGIPKRRIAIYCLIGYNDTPTDALYRLQTIRDELGSYPIPMRYQPTDAERKNEHVAPHWTDWELRAYTKYWWNLKLKNVPFSQFLETYQKHDQARQGALL